MSIDERRRLELADAAQRALGDEAGITLMELLPPVGWADVATKQGLVLLRTDFERQIVGLEQRIDARFDRVERGFEHRFQLMEQRIEAIDQRIETMDQRFEAKVEALEHKVLGAFHKEMTAQTWRLVIAATALFGAFGAVIKL